MPKFLVETNSGTYEIEADKEPTVEDVEFQLRKQAREKKENTEYAAQVRAQSQVGERPGPLSRTGNARLEGSPTRPSAGMAADLVLEAGIPMAAQAITTPVGPAAQAAVGAGSSALGNLLAQGRRLAMDEQQDFSTGQLAQATATGAIPFAGPAKNAARVARPIVAAVSAAGKTGAKMALVGYAGEALKTEIDEGRLPTFTEGATAAGVPFALGGGGSMIGSAAKGISSAGRRVAENAADYSALGVAPTPGMLLPEELASAESRVARKTPTGETAQSVDEVYRSLKEGIQGVAPNPIEGAKIFEQASPLIGQISTAETELAKLNKAAIDANAKARLALAELGESRAAQDAAKSVAVAQRAEELSAQAFDQNLKSALENAREISIARTTGGTAGVDPATARDLFVEQVAKPARAAFEERSAQMYSGVDNTAPAFSSQPILEHAENLASEVTGGLPKKLEGVIKLVRENLGGEKVSLQALRNARSEILRKVRLNEFGSDSEERLIKGVAAEITRQIDSQAVSALGIDGGETLKAANKFYRETMPLFDQRGVDVLFSSKPSDSYVKQVVDGIKKSGINSDEYKNIQSLIAGISKGGDDPKLTPELNQTLTDLASAAKGHVNDLVKKSVIFDASRINPSSATGELTVDGGELLKSLREMGRVPGTLEQLGLGSPKQVAELETLFSKYPEASKLSSKEWDQLFSSPAFRAETVGGGWSKVELSTKLQDVMAASQSDNLLLKAANLRAAGRVDAAQKTLNEALRTVEDVGGNIAAVRQRYETLLRDPVAIAFNNPNLPDTDFNALSRVLFDPKPSKITNEAVSEMASALRNSPRPENKALLRRLQERYIEDKIASYASAPPSSGMLKRPDVDEIASFFDPVNASDAQSEINRAAALLDPAQLDSLKKFGRAARAVGRYEALGESPSLPSGYDLPVYGQLRMGLRAVADLYREGKYKLAASLLADPAKFSRYSNRVGATAETAGTMAERAALGVGRSVSNQQETPVSP